MRVEVPLNEYGMLVTVEVEAGGLVLGIEDPDGSGRVESLHAVADTSAAMALIPALLDAVAQVNPVRPITDELLEWALVRESVRRGSIVDAGGYLEGRLVGVAVELHARAKAERGGEGDGA